MTDTWKPPRIVDHSGPEHELGQLYLPGMPGFAHVPRTGIDRTHPLFREARNPNVWGTLAHASHNPLVWGPDHDHQHENWDNAVEEGAYDDDPSLHDLHAKAFDRIKKTVGAGKPCLAIAGGPLHQVLDDGRIKSQFETGTSNGALNHRSRSLVERRHYGYPTHHVDPSDLEPDSPDDDDEEPQGEHPDYARPVYGFLAKHPLRNTSSEQYGQHVLVMKKHQIWHRTTASVGDSLNYQHELTPQPASDFGEHGVPLRSHFDLYHTDFSYPDSTRNRLHAIKKHDLDRNPDYTEAQYHGGLGLHDVHYAILRGGGPGNADLKEHLNDKKIPWVHTDRPWSGESDDPAISSWQHHALRFQEYLERREAAMAQRVIATQGDGRYLILLPDGQGQIADTERGLIWPAQSVASISARGYWTEYEPGQAPDAEDILALVRPAV